MSTSAGRVRPRIRPSWAGPGERWTLLGAIASALAVAACTLLIYPLATIAPSDSFGVVYLLAVLLVSIYRGVGPGVATAIASAAAFDYFHIEPDDSFAIASSRNWVALIVFLIVALMGVVLAGLTERLRIEAAERGRESESRARVLRAADEERRRVVRDLHDGAQQRLVHTVITLKLAQRAQRAGDPSAAALVDEALGHAERATAELRDLSHGILPAALARGGLRAAVGLLATRSTLPVSVDVPPGRLPPTLEATAYFVVAEALTNVVKHADADRAEVRATVDRGELRIEVRDDGKGGALLNGSSGLLGLQDRVATLQGRLDVRSPAGGGTVICARLPIPG